MPNGGELTEKQIIELREREDELRKQIRDIEEEAKRKKKSLEEEADEICRRIMSWVESKRNQSP